MSVIFVLVGIVAEAFRLSLLAAGGILLIAFAVGVWTNVFLGAGPAVGIGLGSLMLLALVVRYASPGLHEWLRALRR